MHTDKYPITGIVSNDPHLALIPKPDDHKVKMRTVVYVVDSRDRNTDKFPDPANYRIDLSDEFHDIKEIELLNVQLPDTVYTINKNNDQLTMYYGNHKAPISLIHGHYKTGTELAEAVQYGIHSARPHDSPLCSVEYIAHLNRILIRNTGLYQDGRFHLDGFLTFDFAGNQFPYGDGTTKETILPRYSCGEVLGFTPTHHDMYVGTAYLNPISDVDDYTKSYGQRTDPKGPDTEPILDMDDTHSGVFYLLRSLRGNLANLLQVPQTTTVTPRILERLFVRRVSRVEDTEPNPFLALRLRGPDNCLREDVDSYLMESDTDYEIPHGEYEVYVDYILAPNMIDLDPFKYLLLRVPRCHRLQSSDKTTMQSFAKIPVTPDYSPRENSVIKYFNPVLPTLNQLAIQFYPYMKYGDGTTRRTFDFAGGEHVLTFSIVHYKQALNYGD